MNSLRSNQNHQRFNKNSQPAYIPWGWPTWLAHLTLICLFLFVFFTSAAVGRYTHEWARYLDESSLTNDDQDPESGNVVILDPLDANQPGDEPEFDPRVAQALEELELTEEAWEILTKNIAEIKIFDESSNEDYCPGMRDRQWLWGCYMVFSTGFNDRQIIHILENHDTKTALAHEILHVIYTNSYLRDSTYKTNLKVRLQQVAQKQETKTKALLERYKDLKEEAYFDELHSFIGTEYEDIGEKLEAHYARYFKARKRIVGFNLLHNKMSRHLNNAYRHPGLKSQIDL